ncbi:MAG: endonuclease Q family protein, partial [Geminicoccaceae bacterium]
MRFYADLHVHSKYSRATSKNADLEHLAYWAAKKGIALVGTGDFTHPAWISEIKEKLVPAEPGLFQLRPEIESEIRKRLPAACQTNPVRFMLEVEISTIYKKGEKTRKIHHLIYVPDLDAAERLITSLSRIGNLKSDGRPILGLDSRDLLETTLQSGPNSYLIPAHIWTPWFAAMGSRSGFDSIADCYGDLADHIFAVETGLSSDPEMNWRVSSLDKYRLVSNSDAHSPIKLGREATAFDCELSYFAVKHALETGEGFVGTVEFFPDEGKYHLDGHRKCKVRLQPEETKRRDGRCPKCGKPLTVGVLHRVNELADRRPAEVKPPATAGDVTNLVPLHEIISEIVGTGPKSKRVERGYQHLVTSLGSELDILNTIPIEDIRKADSTLLGEAISRLRHGDVIREGGYDGEYGVIRLFEEDELQEASKGGLLFDLPKAIGEKPPLALLTTNPIPKKIDASRVRPNLAPAPSQAGGTATAATPQS